MQDSALRHAPYEWWMMMMFGQRHDPSITLKLRAPAAGQASVLHMDISVKSWPQNPLASSADDSSTSTSVVVPGHSWQCLHLAVVCSAVWGLFKKYQCAWLIYELFAWAHPSHVESAYLAALPQPKWPAKRCLVFPPVSGEAPALVPSLSRSLSVARLACNFWFCVWRGHSAMQQVQRGVYWINSCPAPHTCSNNLVSCYKFSLEA